MLLLVGFLLFEDLNVAIWILRIRIPLLHNFPYRNQTLLLTLGLGNRPAVLAVDALKHLNYAILS